MAIDEPFNPLIHRIKGAVKERAIHPAGPVPPIPPILTKFTGAPEDIIEAAQSQIDTLIQSAEVKKGNVSPPQPRGVASFALPPSQLTTSQFLLKQRAARRKP